MHSLHAAVSRLSRRKYLVAALLTMLLSVPLLAREASEIKINLKTSMSGASFNGELPHGKVEFEMEGTTRRLFFELDNIDLPNGTVVDVLLNGTKIGSVSVRNHGGTFFHSTFANQAVPTVSIGNTVSVKFGGTRLMSGKF